MDTLYEKYHKKFIILNHLVIFISLQASLIL